VALESAGTEGARRVSRQCFGLDRRASRFHRHATRSEHGRVTDAHPVQAVRTPSAASEWLSW